MIISFFLLAPRLWQAGFLINRISPLLNGEGFGGEVSVP